MNWVELAEKIKSLIIEKKPKNLSMTIYDKHVMVYTDDGLEFKMPVEPEEEQGEKRGEKSEPSAEAPSSVPVDSTSDELKKIRVVARLPRGGKKSSAKKSNSS